ncbi:hypothetical protein D3C80_1927300 [compost metagenome]
MPYSRMHNHAPRLVDHNNIAVFISHIKRNIFGYQVSYFRFRYGYSNNIACRQLIIRFYRSSVYRNMPV